MKCYRTADLEPAELIALVRKPPFDEWRLNAAAAARVRELFGQDLTPAAVVGRIIADVRADGDRALIEYTRLIDGATLSPAAIAVDEAEFAQAEAMIDPAVRQALAQAVDNVRRYHQEQLPRSWFTLREQGAMLGQCCLPLERVGVYVPGGKAGYPSSVIMNVVPAAVAGVREIYMVTPPARDGAVDPYVLAAARMTGVTRVFKLGGAQAVAALAFGTATIPRVDKITGPGNIFVTLAKKAVYGHCDIDMLAGPSEILIIADQTADAAYVAADLLSQAEHDEMASSVLITDSAALAARVEQEVRRQLAALPRRDIAAASLDTNGLILIVHDMAAAIELANLAAPEHLEIIAAEPLRLLPEVRHAGAVFLGPYSPEPLGDYLAGPNHILPTGGTARFYSVLNVESFIKRTSVIAYTREALTAASDHIVALARAEGLEAHANAVRIRGKERCL